MIVYGNAEIYDGTTWRTFIVTKHNDKVGLLDLTDGSFHEQLGAGSPTISEEPAS